MRVLLFDPLAVPDEMLELAAAREPVVVLTAPWHERDTQSLLPAHGAPTDRAALEYALSCQL